MAKEKFEPVDVGAAELVRDEDGSGCLDFPMGRVIEVIMELDADKIREAIGEFAVRRAAAFFTAVGSALDSAVDEAERKRADSAEVV